MSKSILPFKSLDAVTAVGPGISRDLEGVSNQVTLQAFATGAPTFSVILEGSLDGENWYRISSGSSNGGFVSTLVSNGYYSSGNPGGFYIPHVRYVRARLSSLTGGTNPTVTAWIAVGEIL